jgi:molybdopterin-guanine dinucleotide biosynthesis protein A
MVRAASEGSARAVALADGAAFRPLPCVLRTEEARAEARSIFDAGGRSLHAVLEALAVQVVPERVWTVLDPDRATLRDVDRPEDLPAP